SEVIESDWTLCVRLLQLDEGVPAHLDISRHQLPLRIRVPNDFTKSQFVPVPGQRLSDVRHADRHVVQPHRGLTGRALRDSRLNGGSNQNPCNEQKQTTHRQLPSAKKTNVRSTGTGQARTVLHPSRTVKYKVQPSFIANWQLTLCAEPPETAR